jgi:starch synthase (maltosyl-transferring)
LSSTYGIYNGFELLEHEAIPGREEYLDSEKYEIKVRDWNRPGNIKAYIRALNFARRANPALQQTSNLRFVTVDDSNVICFIKISTDNTNTVAAAIALSGDTHEIWLPLNDMRIKVNDDLRPVVAVENLLTSERHPVEWGGLRVRINSQHDPALLFRCMA